LFSWDWPLFSVFLKFVFIWCKVVWVRIYIIEKVINLCQKLIIEFNWTLSWLFKILIVKIISNFLIKFRFFQRRHKKEKRKQGFKILFLVSNLQLSLLHSLKFDLFLQNYFPTQIIESKISFFCKILESSFYFIWNWMFYFHLDISIQQSTRSIWTNLLSFDRSFEYIFTIKNNQIIFKLNQFVHLTIFISN
jgi:hypothetical protein